MPSLYVHYRIGRALRVVKYVCSRRAAVEYRCTYNIHNIYYSVLLNGARTAATDVVIISYGLYTVNVDYSIITLDGDASAHTYANTRTHARETAVVVANYAYYYTTAVTTTIFFIFLSRIRQRTAIVY